MLGKLDRASSSILTTPPLNTTPVAASANPVICATVTWIHSIPVRRIAVAFSPTFVAVQAVRIVGDRLYVLLPIGDGDGETTTMRASRPAPGRGRTETSTTPRLSRIFGRPDRTLGPGRERFTRFREIRETPRPAAAIQRPLGQDSEQHVEAA